jgi:hypothetical protein
MSKQTKGRRFLIATTGIINGSTVSLEFHRSYPKRPSRSSPDSHYIHPHPVAVFN